MLEPKGDYEVFLETLLTSLRKKKGGEEYVAKLKVELKCFVDEATFREVIVQLIAKEEWRSRMAILLLKPTLVIPYMIRIKRIN